MSCTTEILYYFLEVLRKSKTGIFGSSYRLAIFSAAGYVLADSDITNQKIATVLCLAVFGSRDKLEYKSLSPRLNTRYSLIAEYDTHLRSEYYTSCLLSSMIQSSCSTILQLKV